MDKNNMSEVEKLARLVRIILLFTIWPLAALIVISLFTYLGG